MKGSLVLIEKFVLSLTQQEVFDATERDYKKGIASENYYLQGDMKKKEAIRDWAAPRINALMIPGVRIMPLIDGARVNLTIGGGAEIITTRFK